MYLRAPESKTFNGDLGSNSKMLISGKRSPNLFLISVARSS